MTAVKKDASADQPGGAAAQPSFRLSEVFPLVYDIIGERAGKGGPFLSHDDMVAALLDDAEARTYIDGAASRNQHSVTWNAANMVAWFSHWYTRGENKYQHLLERKKIHRAWAYRTKHAAPQITTPDPDVQWAMEGAPHRISHLKRERDPSLVKAKLQAVQKSTGRLACECCGFEAATVFHGLDAHLLEVHHRQPLAAMQQGSKVTLADLAVLCPTCHRAIHRADCVPVEAFRSKYLSASLTAGATSTPASLATPPFSAAFS